MMIWFAPLALANINLGPSIEYLIVSIGWATGGHRLRGICPYTLCAMMEEDEIKYPSSSPQKLSSHFIQSRTAAMRPLPFERALKTDLVSILVAYQQQYSNTNL